METCCGSPSLKPQEAGALRVGIGAADFSQWVASQQLRRSNAAARHISDTQLLAWLRVVARRRQLVAVSLATGRGGSRRARRGARLGTALPRQARSLIGDFLGDQSGAGIVATSLRRKADNVRLQDLSCGLLPELAKAAEQGLMSHHLNQRIEQLPFWRPWMLEPDGPQWIRSCLEERGFKVDVCKVYHTAYAGVQGCSFFELRTAW
mmetsp:Transcript_67002/g.132102  ORF Transcript_67002/g.132102 Transcript_67002/m.132102 type:complete len:207 (+) Transcript_67002:73-693(+)|eukprot:CAMPEP_0172673734 /NCGR_PEP_ID=MMETSP1074-20121228/12330_1 /TAXON_ID=2916 /ORGANISM="Ceratium fusus, Strain PA161109" /LENGTH=206 /DNA_ID=CAMNT_0013491073 /DNA_START=73 /DNA_END=693 /DNA_ORIENTATION=+